MHVRGCQHYLLLHLLPDLLCLCGDRQQVVIETARMKLTSVNVGLSAALQALQEPLESCEYRLHIKVILSGIPHLLPVPSLAAATVAPS